MAAMGSKAGGCPGGGGRGLWSSLASSHLTHSYPVNLSESPCAPTMSAPTFTKMFPLTVSPAK